MILRLYIFMRIHIYGNVIRKVDSSEYCHILNIFYFYVCAVCHITCDKFSWYKLSRKEKQFI